MLQLEWPPLSMAAIPVHVEKAACLGSIVLNLTKSIL